MNQLHLDFFPSVFFKVLAFSIAAMLLGWLASFWYYGDLATRDIVGSLISVPIFSYLVHLWIAYAHEEETE